MPATIYLPLTPIVLQDSLECFVLQHQEKMPKLVRGVSVTPFSVSVRSTPTALRALAATFRNDTTVLAATLVDIVAIDLVKSPGRFTLKYLFLSTTYNQRLSIELYVDEAGIIPSLATNFFNRQRIFASAGWLEREVWDLFGVYFSEHGDLRRILTDYGFTGHPLRKDFPLTGFQELSYDDVEGRVVSGPVELSQELRVFVF